MCCSWYGNDASVQPVLPPDENSVFLYVLWRMGMHMQHVSLPLLICSWYSHARGCIARVLKCSTPVVFRKIIYISWWASSNRHVVCSMFLATRCLARALGARAAPSYSRFAICLGFFFHARKLCVCLCVCAICFARMVTICSYQTYSCHCCLRKHLWAFSPGGCKRMWSYSEQCFLCACLQWLWGIGHVSNPVAFLWPVSGLIFRGREEDTLP